MPSSNYASWVHSHSALAHCTVLVEVLDVFVMWTPILESAARTNCCPVVRSVATVPRTAPDTYTIRGDRILVCELHHIRRQLGKVSKEMHRQYLYLDIAYFVHLTAECHRIFTRFFPYQQNYSFSLFYDVIVTSVVLTVIHELPVCILRIRTSQAVHNKETSVCELIMEAH
jgi:hypothetical protein